MQGVWMNFNSGYPQRGREAKSLPLRPLFSRPGRKTLRLRATYPQTVQRLWITRFVWKVLGAGADMQSGHGFFCFGLMRQTRANLYSGKTTVPVQVVIKSPKGHNNTQKLM